MATDTPNNVEASLPLTAKVDPKRQKGTGQCFRAEPLTAQRQVANETVA